MASFRARWALPIFVSTALASIPAAAVTVDLAFDGNGPVSRVKGRIYHWSDPTPVTLQHDFSGGLGINAGYHQFVGNSGNVSPYDTTFFGFGLEPMVNLGTIGVERPYQIETLDVSPDPAIPLPGAEGMGAAKAAAIERAVFEAYSDVGGTSNWTGLNASQAAALTAAIWEIIYEKPGVAYNPDSGYAVFFNGSLATLNNTLRPLVLDYLAAASNAQAPAAVGLVALTTSQARDLLVPEPATLSLLIGGALLAALRGRRRA